MTLILIIALVWLPPEPITSETPWAEQGIEKIESEPQGHEIDLGRRRIRIMEATPDDH